MRLINPERLIEDKGFFIEDDQGRFMCVVSAEDIRNAPGVNLNDTIRVDGKRDSDKRGHWITHSSGSGAYANNWAECSECHICGSPQWKVCPVCETKMDGGIGNA